jgi:hypothetical protein
MSTKTSEFIALSIYQLKRQGMHSKYQGNFAVEDTEFLAIHCPRGTEDWYPNFVERIHRFMGKTKLPMQVVLISFLYLARAQTAAGLEYENWIACLVIADKLYSSGAVPIDFWSQISGVNIQELIKLEQKLLRLLGAKLHVTKEDYGEVVYAFQSLGRVSQLVE